MGAYLRKRGAEFDQDLDCVYSLFPRVKERHGQIAGTLSGGEQQMVAMGRALMARPRLLCMDEPSMGLAPIFVEQTFDIIQEINRQGTTIFMVEQNANMALSIAHRAYVLQTGQVVLSGTAAELRKNPLIREAYLGEMQVTVYGEGAVQQQVAVGGTISATGPRAVMAAVIGNGLEWYNFMLYGVFAAIIAKLYFPAADQLTSLLLSLGTFSVGFFMRPLGGTLLGMYSDRMGRKAALSLTIMLMCIGTAMIALMPTYAQIGIAAPLLLMVARLLEGVSRGGALGNATAFMREYQAGRR